MVGNPETTGKWGILREGTWNSSQNDGEWLTDSQSCRFAAVYRRPGEQFSPWSPIPTSDWPLTDKNSARLWFRAATACCAVLCAPRFAWRLLTLSTRDGLILDMTLVSALAYFVQRHWRRGPAFRNRTAPHVFVESRR